MTPFLSRFAAVAVACMLALPAGAADLKLFSTIALTEAWHDLKPRFEARGHKLELVMNTSGALASPETAALLKAKGFEPAR